MNGKGNGLSGVLGKILGQHHSQQTPETPAHKQ